jgi:hypothetical protein
LWDFVRNEQLGRERMFQSWAKCTGYLLRKYEVCGRLLFDGRGAGEYNGCIELVGKYGYLWGIFPANPFQLFTKFTHGFV